MLSKTFLFPQKVLNRHSIRFNSVIAQKLVFKNYGNPGEVVSLEEEELRSPGKGEVLLKMLAAPVNPADINTIQGVYPVKPKLPAIGGNEGVGEIVLCGEATKSLKVGDRVLPRTNAWGTWRTYAVCSENELVKISSDLDPIAAATISVNPCTAYRMIKDFVTLEKGDTVIQNGGNSAVGQCAIQMCKQWGLRTVSIIRNRPNVDETKNYLTELGADHVLLEEEVKATALFKKLPKPKLGLNCIGGKNALDMLRHIDHSGVMVTYGGMSREPVTVPTSALIFKDVSIRGYWMTRWTKENAGSSEQVVMLGEIVNMFKNGTLKIPRHQLAPISDYNKILGEALSTKNPNGKKIIFDFSQS